MQCTHHPSILTVYHNHMHHAQLTLYHVSCRVAHTTCIISLHRSSQISTCPCIVHNTQPAMHHVSQLASCSAHLCFVYALHTALASPIWHITSRSVHLSFGVWRLGSHSCVTHFKFHFLCRIRLMKHGALSRILHLRPHIRHCPFPNCATLKYHI